jgi:hypothetical protein
MNGNYSEVSVSRAEFERFRSNLSAETTAWEKRSFFPGGQVLCKMKEGSFRLQKHVGFNPPPAVVAEFQHHGDQVILRWQVERSLLLEYFPTCVIGVLWIMIGVSYLSARRSAAMTYTLPLMALVFSVGFFLINGFIKMQYLDKSEELCGLIMTLSLRATTHPAKAKK